MNIGILSSTFLFPGNHAWEKIRIKKSFCELGDYKVLRERKLVATVLAVSATRQFTIGELSFSFALSGKILHLKHRVLTCREEVCPSQVHASKFVAI